MPGPWLKGCTPVSPGCGGCWLAGISSRNLPGLTGDLTTGGHFNGRIVCREDRLQLPLRKRKRRVFAIWSDLFHKDVPGRFLDQAFAIMGLCPEHEFVIVTKRPEVALRYLSLFPRAWNWKDDDYSDMGRLMGLAHYAAGQISNGDEWEWRSWPLSNVTILVTMEDQQRVNERFPSAMGLVDLGWRVGALCEPLLGPISFRWAEGWPGNVVHTAQQPDGPTDHLDALRRLSWVITGGESGHKARPAHPAWFRALRDQAVEAGLPFMFKQWGEWLSLDDIDQSNPAHLGCLRVSSVGSLSASGIYRRENCVLDSDEVFVAKVGKKKAGRSLDGREWLEVP